MSTFNRLIGMAQKALDKKSAPNRDGHGTTPQGSGATDWRAMVKSAADALTGEDRSAGARSTDARPQNDHGRSAAAPYGTPAPAGARDAAPQSFDGGGSEADDRRAIARYDYLLHTADPHEIEQVHREAFARLTPRQREQIEARMRAELPANEQPRSAAADDLARTATTTEVRTPGLLGGLLARAGGTGGGSGGSGRSSGRGAVAGAAVAGAGIGAAGGLLAAVAGTAVLSTVAGPLLAQAADIGVDFDSLAAGIDLDAITSGADLDGLTGGLGDAAAGLGDAAAGLGDGAAGLGEQVSGLGDRLSGFEIPGLGDLFGR